MTEIRKFEQGSDWAVEGSAIAGKGEAARALRGLQADLNLFASALSFEQVKVDGLIGAQSGIEGGQNFINRQSVTFSSRNST